MIPKVVSDFGRHHVLAVVDDVVALAVPHPLAQGRSDSADDVSVTAGSISHASVCDWEPCWPRQLQVKDSVVKRNVLLLHLLIATPSGKVWAYRSSEICCSVEKR